MDWLRRLRRPRQSEASPSYAGAANPIHAWLDDAGVPWRESRAALAVRYGVRRDPAYDWKVVEIATVRPALPDLIRPLGFQVFDGFSPRLPALSFSAITWSTRDARANLRRTADAVAGLLGQAAVVRDQWNTVRADWTCDRARIELIGWPADLQSGRFPNPSHEREPRLASACHVYVHTGWRPALLAAEAAWLEDCRVVADLPATTGEGEPPESEIEYIREADAPGLQDRIALSADGRALLFQIRHLYLVPLDDVVGLNADRLLPAKGGGGSTLYLACRSDGVEKRLLLAQASGPDDLNALGQRIAAAIGRPLTLEPYVHDV